MKQLAFLIALTCFCISASYAQIPFQGIVIDENNTPVLDAIAIHLNNKNAILGTSLVDTNGYFQFEKVDFLSEKISVTALGFQTEEVKEALDHKIMKIILSGLSLDLNEVVVTGKSTVVQKSDRLVFHISNSHLTKGNNTYELLKLTPLVQENNRKINIIGKESVLLYINGRKSNLTQDALHNYLQSLPAENIASIEVITNPGVTYSTSGDQGIINLVLKKNEANGLKGNVYLEDSQSPKKNSQNGSVYLEYQKDKFNATSNLYINNENSFFENTTDYYFYQDNIWNKGENEINSQHLYAGANLRMDYNRSNNHTLGALLDISYIDRKSNSTNDTRYFSSLHVSAPDSVYHAYNKSAGPTDRVSTNLNYRGRLSEKGSMLSVDIDYISNNKDQKVYNHFNRLPTDGLPDFTTVFEERSKDKFHNYSGKADYKHAFNNKHSLTGGVEFYKSASRSDFNHINFGENQLITDPTKSNCFDYDEIFLSGYLAYNWVINEKITGSGALKAENANSKGIQKVTGEKIERHDFNWIPNLSVLYQLNTTDRLSYNLSSHASRPYYYALNPFRFYINPNTYKEYNPHLKTGSTYFQSLSYALKNSYIFGFNYNYFKNPTNNFLIPVEGNYMKLINANYGSLHTYSMNFTWISSFFDNRLSNRVNVSGEYRRSKGRVETVVINNEGFSYDLSFYSNFTLSQKNNWNLTLNGFYSSKIKLAHEDINKKYNISAGVRKVFPGNISLNLGIRRIINRDDIRQRTTPDYRYYINSNYYTQTAYISLSVPFGNQKTKGAQYRRTSSSETNNRLKE